MLRKLLYLFLIMSTTLMAQCYEFKSSLVPSPVTGNQLYLEPTISYATYKTADIDQNGYLYGIAGGYDLLVFNAPYLGFESYYKSGKIKGSQLSSRYTDYLFEGKLGFTIGSPGVSLLIPFAGIGYENEKNDYSKVPIEKLAYYYFSVGIFSQAFLNPQLSIGLDAKIKFPFRGNHKVKNYSVDTKLSVSKKIQYVIEIPLTYWASNQLSFSAVPFYEHKNYNNNCTGTEVKAKATMSQWGLGLRGTVCY